MLCVRFDFDVRSSVHRTRRQVVSAFEVNRNYFMIISIHLLLMRSWLLCCCLIQSSYPYHTWAPITHTPPNQIDSLQCDWSAAINRISNIEQTTAKQNNDFTQIMFTLVHRTLFNLIVNCDDCRMNDAAPMVVALAVDWMLVCCTTRRRSNCARQRFLVDPLRESNLSLKKKKEAKSQYLVRCQWIDNRS